MTRQPKAKESVRTWPLSVQTSIKIPFVSQEERHLTNM